MWGKISKITSKLISKYNFPFSTKDVRNMIIKWSNKEKIDSIIEALKDTGFVDIYNSENELEGLVYQDTIMREDWARFGEYMVIDSTFKTINVSWSFFILVGIDYNRKTIVFGWFLLVNESYRLLSKAFMIFTKNNKYSINRFYITDKDLSERKVLLELFPNSKRFICRSHVLKFFKSYLRKTNFNLSREEYRGTMIILKKMIYVKSDLEYILLRGSLPDTVKIFYMDNWDSCRNEFIEHFKESGMCLNIHTTNNAESYFSSLKRFIKLRNDMAKFINEIVEFTMYKRNIVLRENMMKIKRIHRLSLSYTTPFDNLKGSLSYFAFTTMINAYKTSLEYTPNENVSSSMLMSCCNLRKQYLLPCKHVMYFLGNNNGNKSWNNLGEYVNKRWYVKFDANALLAEINQNRSICHSEIKIGGRNKSGTLNIDANFTHHGISSDDGHTNTKTIYISERVISKTSELKRFQKLRHITDKLASKLSQEGDIEFTMKLAEYMVKCIDNENLNEFSNRFDIIYIPKNKDKQNRLSNSINK